MLTNNNKQKNPLPPPPPLVVCPIAEEPETPTHSLQREMGASELWTSKNPESAKKSDLALNRRNLKDSKQGNYLTFSDSNLPVNSKRRVKDNVNMHDHIKEQNIVESSTWTELPRDMGLLATGSTYGDEFISNGQLERLEELEEQKQQQFSYSHNNRDHLNYNTDIGRVEALALIDQQEEEDAVEEIQRCTSSSTTTTTTTTSKAQANSGGPTRLKRTCQNQNFDIFENENPEPKHNDKVISKASSIVSARASPQAKQNYKNLFSESPDFILTTGKFLYEEAKALDNENKPNGKSKDLATKVESNELQAGGLNPPDCRIFKLDDEFDYVGTRLGHRYYTEKHHELDK